MKMIPSLSVLRSFSGPVWGTAVTLVTAVGLTGCGGGGGGGGEYVGAALVAVNSSPGEIDPGDRSQITTFISEVDENGIFLKFKFPEAIRYVTESTTLEVDGETVEINPRVNRVSEGNVYLVYSLNRSRFGENAQGTLRFQLEGVEESSSGSVEVDADVDDPLIPNSSEFDIDNPEFGAEDTAELIVRD